ncbi:MAG TPA: WYL domain-containing protein [Longimicrobiales bacterium]|nr:WYL domain-containing protein [Longimicrobiales bacterium]
MSEGRTAPARLGRLLHVLPAASRPDGATLSELARALGASEERILEDLEEVTARAYYHPGGWPDDVQILVQSGRVRVLHAAGLDRPVKLSPLETLCLALALRGTAASAVLAAEREREDLLRRVESHLAAFAWEGGDTRLAAPERTPDPEGLRELMIGAVGDRRACAIHYVKPGATDGSVRVVHPYGMAYAEGHWYAVAHCTVEDDVRVFRLDRILAADVTERLFELPVGFQVEEYVKNGRVYHAQADRPLRVRYSARIARWIRERAEWESAVAEELEDGSVVLSHRAADPWWAVTQALQYGAEAEILEPADVRALVAQVAEELAGGAE